jgi:ferredoxin
MGVIAAATGDTASKYVARRETPLYIPENCTQCMECISVCPDTALPNTSQDLSTLLTTAVSYYIADAGERTKLLRALPEIEKQPASAWSPKSRPEPRCPPSFAKSPTTRKLLAAIQAAVLRHHRQGPDGLPEGQRHLLLARAQGARLRRHLLHLRQRSLQRLRRLRHRLRRSQRPPHGCRNRRSQRRARNRHRLPQPAARHFAESISASSTPPTRPTPRPRPCATCSWSAPTTTPS